MHIDVDINVYILCTFVSRVYRGRNTSASVTVTVTHCVRRISGELKDSKCGALEGC